MTKKNKEIKKKGREETHPPLRDESNRDEVPFLIIGCRGHPCPRRCGTHGGFHIKSNDLPSQVLYVHEDLLPQIADCLFIHALA